MTIYEPTFPHKSQAGPHIAGFGEYLRGLCPAVKD